MPIDCLTCGACCGPAMEDDRLPLTEEDVHRLGPEWSHVVTRNADGGLCLAVRDDRGELVCAALEGRIGEDARCAVHDRKPKVCRDFEPGGEDCLLWREARGIDPLPAETLRALEEGIESVRTKPVVSLGSFAEYADDE